MFNKRLHILRLISVAPWGVGGAEVGALDLIYSFLLQKFNCDFYSHILINQIGDDLEEVIIKNGKGIIINVRYLTENFLNKSISEKNEIRLDIIHTALNRLAEKERKLDVVLLEKIRNQIRQHNFLFEFIYKQYEDKKNQLLGILLIHPLPDKFCYYFLTEKNGVVISKILIYEGKCSHHYIRDIFYKGKWANSKEFVIKDKNKEFEMHIFIEEGRIELINLTRYKKPPYFEMVKAGGPHDEAYKDWLHSLPPGVAGVITHEPN